MTNNADAQIARQWAEAWAEEPTNHLLAAVRRHILATTAPPTMADIAWDDDVHAGLCAESTDDGVVRMIGPDWVNDHADHILCRLLPGGIDSLPMSSLIPLPGTRLDLTPRRTHADLVTAASIEDYKAGRIVDFDLVDTPGELPHPEDVKPDPQPGEAWLIEYEGKRYEAVYWYSELYAHWSFVYDRERGLSTVESPEAAPVSRLVPERAPSHPSVLTIEAEYRHAPAGTVVAAEGEEAWTKNRDGLWETYDIISGYNNYLMAEDGARCVLRWGETL